jgi:hypothetical protein
MQADKDLTPPHGTPSVDQKKKGSNTLELSFILFITLLVAAAFLRSLTYDFVSARAPLVILVPLLILCGVQLKRAWSNSRGENVKARLAGVAKLHNQEFNGIAGFLGWMIVLLILIYVTGHFVGIFAFMFFLMNMVAREKLVLSLSIAGGVTLIIYLLFEHLFNIELYRGMIFRIWMGYGI